MGARTGAALAMLAIVGAAACTTEVPPDPPSVTSEIKTGLARTKGGPDLAVVIGDHETVHKNIQPDGCAVVEKCALPGRRKLLRFDVYTPNVGDRDIDVGEPGGRSFDYSECHEHYHLKGYALYELLDLDDRPVKRKDGTPIVGRKQAFCLFDAVKYFDDAPPSNGYSCGRQGITAGWADYYGKNLDCQWLDVTGVPKGKYKIRVTVNVAKNGVRPIAETNLSNNVATKLVELAPES